MTRSLEAQLWGAQGAPACETVRRHGATGTYYPKQGCQLFPLKNLTGLQPFKPSLIMQPLRLASGSEIPCILFE